MSQEPPIIDDNNQRLLTIEEKIEKWEKWDDSQWQPEWMKVYGRVVAWAAGGTVLGAAHALTTGRAVIPNALVFAGYTTIISGSYFVSREALLGREIERFRQESLGLGLTESQARNYPWRWDMLCGGISGALFSTLVGQRRMMVAVGAGVFATAALALRAGSAAASDYILPALLPTEQMEMERSKRRQILSEREVQGLEAREEEERLRTKPWLFRNLPDWSPVQVYTKDEQKQREEDKEYTEWLESEVDSARKNVQIKRRLQQLELEREARERNLTNGTIQTAPNTSSSSTLGPNSGSTSSTGAL